MNALGTLHLRLEGLIVLYAARLADDGGSDDWSGDDGGSEDWGDDDDSFEG